MYLHVYLWACICVHICTHAYMIHKQVFKWVRKAEVCQFKVDNENGESSAIDHEQLAAAFGAEPEVGQRRLTRGKAADMGTAPSQTVLSYSPPLHVSYIRMQYV